MPPLKAIPRDLPSKYLKLKTENIFNMNFANIILL